MSKPYEIIYHTIGGNCPVQIEGTIAGKDFYFRARGQHWSIGIGGEPVSKPEWYYQEMYGLGPYDAGWMTIEEAKAFVEKAAGIFQEKQGIISQ
jgi:hypothetical protein